MVDLKITCQQLTLATEVKIRDAAGLQVRPAEEAFEQQQPSRKIGKEEQDIQVKELDDKNLLKHLDWAGKECRGDGN